jgi:hypothetical protein
MRPSVIAARLVSCVAMLAVASCANVPPVAGPGAAASAGGAATVMAVRPIVAVDTGADAAGWRAALLNGAPSATDSAPTAVLAEFIVREDAGATLSIVQSNAAGLHVGDRVVVIRRAADAGRASLTRVL